MSTLLYQCVGTMNCEYVCFLLKWNKKWNKNVHALMSANLFWLGMFSVQMMITSKSNSFKHLLIHHWYYHWWNNTEKVEYQKVFRRFSFIENVDGCLSISLSLSVCVCQVFTLYICMCKCACECERANCIFSTHLHGEHWTFNSSAQMILAVKLFHRRLAHFHRLNPLSQILLCWWFDIMYNIIIMEYVRV